MQEILNNFHFATPYFLLLIPVIIAVYYLLNDKGNNYGSLNFSKYKKLASLENLKHLLKKNRQYLGSKGSLFLMLFFIFLSLSLARPRWDYQEIQALEMDTNIVILLDSSSSMNVKDILPSRYIYTKDEIAEIIDSLKDLRAGLIAFTDIPYIISPLTKDLGALKQNLKALNVDDFTVQGTNINEALRLSLNFYRNIEGDDKFVLLMSDGDFTVELDKELVAKMKEQKIKFFAFAIGTEIGGPVFKNSKVLKHNGSNVTSKLNLKNLENLAKELGGGVVTATSDKRDLESFLSFYNKFDSLNKSKKKQKIWYERFYIFLIPALLCFLVYFRNTAFVLALLLCYGNDVHANPFLNQEQKAKQAFKDGDFIKAQENFKTPYNRGVSAYRNGDFASAAKEFKLSAETDLNSKFNLGNSYFMQQDYQKAIAEYEGILEKHNDHKEAKHNLEVAKKMLQQQNQQQNKQQNSQSEQGNEGDKKQQNQDQSDNKNKEQEQKTSPETKQEHQNIFQMIETDPSNLLKQKIKNKEAMEDGNTDNSKPW